METKTVSSPIPDYSGSFPRYYEECLGPFFFEPYAVEVSKRINSSSIDFALEIACGTGRVTRHLRSVIPTNAKLVASDLSADMLSVAKEKSGTLNIEWQIIDAQELPFADNGVDLIICCFGYMFVSDKSKAYAEAYRVLKPGGMLLIATWDKLEHNGASYVYRTVAKKYLTEPLPERYNLPTSMNDDEEIRRELQLAGFSKIIIERVEKISVSASAKEAATILTEGGSVYDEIMKQNPVSLNEIKEAVEKELAEKFGTSPMKAPLRALITQAWK
jgi:ubiquinone/menaquinone biosynthesis C-methylase UbiE